MDNANNVDNVDNANNVDNVQNVQNLQNVWWSVGATCGQVHFTWVYFTFDGLSVYTAAGESLNVGIKLTSYIAEVGIRKVSQDGGSWQQVGDYQDRNFEIEDNCLIQLSQEQ